jgi:hypothetical protein
MLPTADQKRSLSSWNFTADGLLANKSPKMKHPGKMTVLAGVILLALAGCQQRTIDATQFKEAEWEKSITGSSLSENEFVRLYALKLANELKGSTVRITGRRELKVKLADGTELKALLDNVCADVKANPTNRIEICNKYITGLVRTQQTINDAAGVPDTNSIVVVIRDDLFLKQFENYGATKTNRVVAEPLVADLHVAYARDSENGIAYLMEADQSKLGLGLPALRQLALSNLHRILPAPKIYKIGPVFMIEADGNYESSLLLADTLWDRQAFSGNWRFGRCRADAQYFALHRFGISRRAQSHAGGGR